jgi:hypothetical protein
MAMHLLTAICASAIMLGGINSGLTLEGPATQTTTHAALDAGAILGSWDCTADFGDGNKLPFSMLLEEEDGVIAGEIETGDGQRFIIWDGSYDAESGEFEATIAEAGSDDGAPLTATFEDGSFEGEVATPEGVVVIAGTKN